MESWFVLPERKRRVFRTVVGGSGPKEEEEPYYDVGDAAGLIGVAIAGGIMIVMLSGMAAYKQYRTMVSNSG